MRVPSRRQLLLGGLRGARLKRSPRSGAGRGPSDSNGFFTLVLVVRSPEADVLRFRLERDSKEVRGSKEEVRYQTESPPR